MTTDSEGHASERTEIVGSRRAEQSDDRCPVCATSRVPSDRYCEGCGYDLRGPTSGWSVVITADRAFYDRQAPEGVDFPSDFRPRHVWLEGDEVEVGRASASRGADPGIDLSVEPRDPGISHRHARFVRATDGSFSLIDVGSMNGTMLNDSDDPIEPNHAVPLADGDRVHLGAWTTLLIRVS